MAGDIERVYDKIDETNKAVSDLRVDIAELKVVVKGWKAPERPCAGHNELRQQHNQLREEFNNHITEHDTMDKEVKEDKKENVRMWKNSGVDLVFELVKLGIVGGIGGLIGYWIG